MSEDDIKKQTVVMNKKFYDDLMENMQKLVNENNKLKERSRTEVICHILNCNHNFDKICDRDLIVINNAAECEVYTIQIV